MRIAICSDIHDNIWKLENALPVMAQADALLFCGDFCAPFTLVQIAEGFSGAIHAVLGNNDGDQRLLLAQASRFDHFTLHGQFVELDLGSMHIAVTHYPDIARGLAHSDRYDAVCYGHDHTLNEETIGDTLLLNPGELMGRFGRSTFMFLDTVERTVVVHDVG